MATVDRAIPGPAAGPRVAALLLGAVLAGATLAGASVVDAQERREVAPTTVEHLFAERGRTGPITRVNGRGGDTISAGERPFLAPGERLKIPLGDAPDRVLAGRIEVAGGPGAARPRPVRAADSLYALPYEFLTLDADGEVEMLLRPVYYRERGLRYDRERGTFRGTLLVGLRDAHGEGPGRALDRPIAVRFLSDADRLEPTSVPLERTNTLHSVEVAARIPVDSLAVRLLVPDLGLDEHELWLPVVPSLVIETAGRPVQGLGIQSVPVTVSVRGRRLDAPTAVRLQAVPRGTVEPATVEIGSEGSASARLRSEWLGATTVQASAAAFEPVEVPFEFVFPGRFLLAALVGALAGAAVGFLGGAPGAADRRGRGLRRVLFGLIAVTAYYAVGINLLPVLVPGHTLTEFAAAAIAALGALFAVPVIEALSRRGASGAGRQAIP